MANCISDADVNEDYPEISIEEVKDAMSQMKRGKAAREDGIPVQLLIAAGPQVVLELQHLFNEAYTTERIPTDWQKGIIINKKVTDYKYLGVNINERNMQEIEINQRIASYNTNVNMLYLILKDQSVPQESKIIIYNRRLKPVIMYGSEMWPLTSNTESKIQAAEMGVLRFIKGITRRGRCRNTNIRAEIRVEPCYGQ